VVDGELCWLSARELGQLYRRRELSPIEVANSVLERIDRLEPSLHTFLTVASESFLRCARLTEQAIVNGDELGLLHGIPSR
jgi:Asp-tRNA(Asn)/Glu-tRNA(Gln) amidotransferase A subunit family amidase